MTDEMSFDAAIRLHQHGRLDDAERVYRQMLDSDPCHAGSLHLLGVIRYQKGDHEAAMELIGRAIALGPAYQ
jgi:Flp pilus assembly protein TadD